MKIDLYELERKEGVEIKLYDDYLTLSDGNLEKISYKDIIDYKYIGMKDCVYGTYSKSMWKLLHYSYDYIVEELETTLQEYEEEYLNK